MPLTRCGHAPLPLNDYPAVSLVVWASADTALGGHVQVIEPEKIADCLPDDWV
jgi:hypothetical protein